MKNFFLVCLIFRVTANPFGYNRWNPQQIQNEYALPPLTFEEVLHSNDNTHSMRQNNYDQFRPNEYAYSRNDHADCLSRSDEIQCSYDYDPICARNGVSGHVESFRNRCELKQRYCLTQTPWLIVHKGVCINACSAKCTENYYPICAYCNEERSNITFKNDCHFNCRAPLEKRGDCRIIKSGTCSHEDYPQSDYKPHASDPSISTFLIKLYPMDNLKSAVNPPEPPVLSRTFSKTIYKSPPLDHPACRTLPPNISAARTSAHFNKTTHPSSQPRGRPTNSAFTTKIPGKFNKTTNSLLPLANSRVSPKNCEESFKELQKRLVSIANDILKYFDLNKARLLLIYKILIEKLSDFGNFCNNNTNITATTSTTKPTTV